MGTELEVVTPADVLLPVDVESAKNAMTAYQQVVNAILEPTDWQGKPNVKGSFVKKSGWRKIAKAYGLSVEHLSESTDRDENGDPIRAKFVVRAIAPNGQHMDGVGKCSVTESRFANPAGRQKLENDLSGTAFTRATNRAISDLVGFGQVSAEEVDAGAEGLEPAEPEDIERTGQALMALYATDDDTPAQKALDAIVADLGGGLPKIVARALQRAAQHRPKAREEGAANTVDGAVVA